MHTQLPDLLPKFIMLVADAERTGNYGMVRPALHALESLGPALEDHLQLLLPALVRLVPPGFPCQRFASRCQLCLQLNPMLRNSGRSGPPPDVRRATLQSMQRLLPRMALAQQASTLLHPMLRLLDGEYDELRKDAVDTICALALAIGTANLAIFVPVIQKVNYRAG